MGAVAPSTLLQSIRKALSQHHAYIVRGHDVRRHHHATVKALRTCEALVKAGFDLDAVTAAVKAAGGTGASPSSPSTNQQSASDVLHAPTIACGTEQCLTTKRVIP